MIKHEVLMDNDWLQLCKMTDDQPPRINGYIYSHEKRCNGNIVAILPYALTKIDDERFMSFLFRVEATPCWMGKIPVIGSFTGGVDFNMRNEDPMVTAIKELKEESGFNCSKLIELGTCFGTKSTDTVYHLYTVDISDQINSSRNLLSESELDETSYCQWLEVFKQKEDNFGIDEDFVRFHKKYLNDPLTSQIIFRTLIKLCCK